MQSLLTTDLKFEKLLGFWLSILDATFPFQAIFDSRMMRSIICESMPLDTVAMENHNDLRVARLGSRAWIPETRLLIS